MTVAMLLLSHLLTDKNMCNEDNTVAMLLLWITFSIVLFCCCIFWGLSSALALFEITLVVHRFLYLRVVDL